MISSRSPSPLSVNVRPNSYEPLAPLEGRAREAAAIFRLSSDASDLLSRILDGIDRDELNALRDRHIRALKRFSAHGPIKYADLPYWIAQKIHVAHSLGLHRERPMSVLDIGTGGGHFPAVLKAMGHDPIGIDVELPLYGDLAALLGVDRRIVGVYAGQALPSFGKRFEWITIHWPGFDVHGEPSRKPGLDVNGNPRTPWILDDWLYLLRDLITNQIVPGGTLHLRLNRHGSVGANDYPVDLLRWSATRGAQVDTKLGEIRFDDLGPGSI